MTEQSVYRPVTYFGCQECGQRSGDMEFLPDMPYEPTPIDFAARPEFGPTGMNIAHEQFRCACGKIHNWFTLDRGSELRIFEAVEFPEDAEREDD